MDEITSAKQFKETIERLEKSLEELERPVPHLDENQRFELRVRYSTQLAVLKAVQPLIKKHEQTRGRPRRESDYHDEL